MDPGIVEGADIERVAVDMEGTEAIVINSLQKSFTGINKKTVHAVQVNIRIWLNCKNGFISFFKFKKKNILRKQNKSSSIIYFIKLFMATCGINW